MAKYCIATQHGYVGECHRTLKAARKELSAIVRRQLRACRRSHRRCSQVGTVREGDVRIRIGGRQGYHLWDRYALATSRYPLRGARRGRRRRKRR